MATRQELRDRLRRRLGDTRATAVWPDETLNDYLADAVREWGVRRPLVAVAAGTMTVGVRSVTLPAGAMRVVAVEWPAGEFIPQDETVPAYTGIGDVPASWLAQAWRWDETARAVIVRNAPPAAAAYRIHYLAGRTPPATDGAAVPVDDVDLEIVVLMAAESAWDARQVEDAKRGLRTPGRNPFAARLVDALRARGRQMRGGLMTPGAG